ncbi:Pseudouridine-5'-phosphate glycosidase [Blattella germanica]|nr:Pseudouridine-5'-phosphate glycosidase [Blattella germanica]
MQSKLSTLFAKQIQQCISKNWKRGINYEKCIDVSSEVSSALKNHKPVVALESTIISHGMPYPQNFETAMQVQEIIKNEGAVPATIAIIGGRIKVGLDEDMLREFAACKAPVIKTSRRDFPYVLSKVFATGGLGGVHRGGEVTMDISADLTELGRNPVTVVSREKIEEAIVEALKQAEIQRIKGKEVTPFILQKVASLTEGKSLESSIL